MLTTDDRPRQARSLSEDPKELKAQLEEAYAQLSLYARDLRQIAESERAAMQQVQELKGQIQAPKPQPPAYRNHGHAAPHPPIQPSAIPTAHAEQETQLYGESAPMRRVLRLCQEVANSDASVILTGETGVGKEVAARAIHRLSHRQARAFVAVNCAALPETLLESELFGHEKGAFTGAVSRKPGHFEMAEGGTLLLDEIGEMPLSMQAKLLRVLEQRCFLRVGGVQLLHCDVRIIAATNRDLKDEIKSGRFRSDLYYRLNVFPIELPPLRDRLEDLAMLIEQVAARFARRAGIAVPTVGEEAMAYLRRHDWPGNIRELRNVIERSMILARGRAIEPQDLPIELVTAVAEVADHQPGPPATPTTRMTHSKLAANEKAMIIEALHINGWNKAATARQLGISWDNLRYRLKKYNLRKPG